MQDNQQTSGSFLPEAFNKNIKGLYDRIGLIVKDSDSGFYIELDDQAAFLDGIELKRINTPPAPASGRVRFFARPKNGDNTKTEIVFLFSGGTESIICEGNN